MLFSASSLNSRFAQLIVFAGTAIALVLFFAPSSFNLRHRFSKGTEIYVQGPRPKFIAQPRVDHPIDHLIQRANTEFDALLKRETKTLAAAAEAYRARRGRHPPPWFDKWFAFAMQRNAVIVEDLWDRIYDDLNPFWALPPKQIRDSARDVFRSISIRNGSATADTDKEGARRINLWLEMFQTVAPYLPDIDIPINIMDEPRIVVPWEEMDKYMRAERATRKMTPSSMVKNQYPNNTRDSDSSSEKIEPQWDTEGPYWQYAVVGCAPDSPARSVPLDMDYTTPPQWVTGWPKGSYQGYVQNVTFAGSPCDHVEMQGLHGSIVEPLSISNTKTLFPIFGGSKLPMNNDILIPQAMYWTSNPFFSGGNSHGGEWEEKHEQLIWRGTASGGRNKVENWARFHRHRFIAMLNATNVDLALNGSAEAPPNFALPTKDAYHLAVHEPGTDRAALTDWIRSWSDAAFVNLECFPATDDITKCPYTDQYFGAAPMKSMEEQYNYKYLPDVDGNSYSARFRGFLGSTSMPLKMTIYREWLDSRLMPWVHYVPMHHTFIDIYGIMEYFVGNADMALAGHDAEAKKIALAGQDWALRTLRKEDMTVYVLRLFLEYARLCNDEREVLGWSEQDNV